MDFFQTIQARHSIRAFTPEPVGPAMQAAILDAANRAPSAGNLQAYEIFVVTSAECREELRLAGGGDLFISQAPLVLVFTANPERSSRRYGERGAMLYALQDATIACAYAQLSATALGLGSVWVGAFNEDLARSALGIGPELRPIAILPIGYPGEEPRIKERRSIDSQVHRVP